MLLATSGELLPTRMGACLLHCQHAPPTHPHPPASMLRSPACPPCTAPAGGDSHDATSSSAAVPDFTAGLLPAEALGSQPLKGRKFGECSKGWCWCMHDALSCSHQ